MKRILTFRCASPSVMGKLFARIGEQDEIACYVQENAMVEYQKKYPHVVFLSIHENYFNYDKFCELADIRQTKFDQIFVPSTSRNFNGFDEIFKIVGLMKYRELILFNCEGREKSELNTVGAKIREFMESKIVTSYSRHIDRHFPGKYRRL